MGNYVTISNRCYAERASNSLSSSLSLLSSFTYEKNQHSDTVNIIIIINFFIVGWHIAKYSKKYTVYKNSMLKFKHVSWS